MISNSCPAWRWLLVLVVVGLWAVSVAAQPSPAVPSDYYRSPLDIPIVLSANVGELRNNHFHSGIDIKTDRVEGKPVYAVADGYVSRIGIVPTGYGRVLYIAHPNATTSVYAHLESFIAPIEKYATDYRYRHSTHVADIFPSPEGFKVRKGDVIGYAGNSGMSRGPHLHFELRESAMQRPLNLLAAGYLSVNDTIPPVIERLYWAAVDTLQGVPIHAPLQAIAVRQTTAGSYTTVDTSAIAVSGNGYFVVTVVDRKSAANNNLGIYRITEKVDARKVFELKLDRFQFSTMRYVNAVCEYDIQRKSRSENFKLAVQSNNFMPIYNGVRNRGLIYMKGSQERVVSIDVEDDSGNVSNATLRIKAGETATTTIASPATSIPSDGEGVAVNCKREFRYTADGASVVIGGGALYESIFYVQSVATPLPVSKTLPRGITSYTDIYSIHRDDVPLHKSIRLSIKADAPENVRSKLSLAQLNGSTYSYAGGVWRNGAVSGSVRSFGCYCVVADTIAPTIAASFKDGEVMTKKSELSFVIGDNFSGIRSFIGTLDGKWMLFEYDVIGRRITHIFDAERFEMGDKRHSIQLEVTDNVGNTTLYDGGFVR